MKNNRYLIVFASVWGILLLSWSSIGTIWDRIKPAIPMTEKGVPSKFYSGAKIQETDETAVMQQYQEPSAISNQAAPVKQGTATASSAWTPISPSESDMSFPSEASSYSEITKDGKRYMFVNGAWLDESSQAFTDLTYSKKGEFWKNPYSPCFKNKDCDPNDPNQTKSVTNDPLYQAQMVWGQLNLSTAGNYWTDPHSPCYYVRTPWPLCDPRNPNWPPLEN